MSSNGLRCNPDKIETMVQFHPRQLFLIINISRIFSLKNNKTYFKSLKKLIINLCENNYKKLYENVKIEKIKTKINEMLDGLKGLECKL